MAGRPSQSSVHLDRVRIGSWRAAPNEQPPTVQSIIPAQKNGRQIDRRDSRQMAGRNRYSTGSCVLDKDSMTARPDFEFGSSPPADPPTAERFAGRASTGCFASRPSPQVDWVDVDGPFDV